MHSPPRRSFLLNVFRFLLRHARLLVMEESHQVGIGSATDNGVRLSARRRHPPPRCDSFIDLPLLGRFNVNERKHQNDKASN